MFKCHVSRNSDEGLYINKAYMPKNVQPTSVGDNGEGNYSLECEFLLL